MSREARQPLRDDTNVADRCCLRRLFPCFRRPDEVRRDDSVTLSGRGLYGERSELFQSCDDLTALPGLEEATRATRLAQELGVTLRTLRQLPELPAGSDEACQRVQDELLSLEAVLAGKAPDSASAASSTSPAKMKLRKVVNVLKDQKAIGNAPGGLATVMNEMIKILWPRIDKFVEELIHNSIQPSINDSLPGMLKGGVKFPKVSLGDASPLLGPMYINYDKVTGAIEMHVGIDFTSELDVELLVMGLPIGITSFFLRGDLVLLFTPPMTKPPFFGGVQVYFPNPPDVGLNFVGAAKVANVPGLRGAVRGAIDSAVAGVCVLPRRIAVDLDEEDDTDIIDLTYPEPLGVLRFTLYSGDGLVAADTGIFGGASSDPYVVASLGLKKWQSPHISKTLNPVWGDSAGLTVDFPVHDDDQALILKVFDYDFGTADDLIGVAKNAVVKDLMESGTGKQQLNLLQADGSPGGGTVTIAVTWMKLEASKPTAPLSVAGPSEAHLSAKVLTIRGLQDHSEYPFKVLINVVSEEAPATKTASAKTRSLRSFSLTSGGTKSNVLADGSTAPSRPKEQKQLAEALQGIAQNLADKSLGPTEIAEILDVGPKQVEAFLSTLPGNDKSVATEQADLEDRNIRNPVFDEVVQFLLPCCTVDDAASVELVVSDKRQKVLATARIPMSSLLEAPKRLLEGPFETDADGIEVIGSLQLRWLA